jgi:hypothetical protein
MQEGDAVTTGSGTGCAVDEFDPLRCELGEVGFKIVRAVGDVMERGPTAVEESSDAGFGTQGFEKLYGAYERDADTLRLEGLGWGTVLAREEFVEAAALSDGVNGDRHVVDGAVRYRDRGHRRMLHSALERDKEKWNGNE